MQWRYDATLPEGDSIAERKVVNVFCHATQKARKDKKTQPISAQEDCAFNDRSPTVVEQTAVAATVTLFAMVVGVVG